MNTSAINAEIDAAVEEIETAIQSYMARGKTYHEAKAFERRTTKHAPVIWAIVERRQIARCRLSAQS